eukprot:577966-Rhodomonas_salina.2
MGAAADIHRKGLIHWDLKPDNIMILPCLRAVTIIDFGHARLSSHPLPRQYGTPGFRAPEQRDSETRLSKHRTAKKDEVWAMGVVMLCMLRKGYHVWLPEQAEQDKEDRNEPRRAHQDTDLAYISVLADKQGQEGTPEAETWSAELGKHLPVSPSLWKIVSRMLALNIKLPPRRVVDSESESDEAEKARNEVREVQYSAEEALKALGAEKMKS